ncbi:hypothetical protein [Oceanobacillus halotolerans]|uniref:hypothetical protein n=1 Tax=Oceanobacillus halotolerans TaxID=2663380 RepID=UPI0013D8F589|nr:hypothetical protein [Oceanobacillus halotolerans]
MADAVTITEKDIERYYELNKLQKEVKQEMNVLKKKFNEFLDDTVGKDQKGEIERGNLKVQRQIRSSTTYKDKPTVEKLEGLNLNEFIVVEKRPDTDKLESAIKLGFVEEGAFEDCKQTKVTKAIVVKEV